MVSRLTWFVAKTLAISATILGAWSLNQVGEFKARCLTSQIIDTLIVFSTGGEIANCRESWFVAGIARHADFERTRGVRRALGEIESLRRYWPAPGDLRLTVEAPTEFRVDQAGSMVMLGKGVSDSVAHLQSAIATAWVARSGRNLTSLEEAILGEFLAAEARGAMRVSDLDGNLFDGEQITFPQAFVEDGEYCRSRWRRPAEVDSCVVDQGENFRPLLSSALWRVHRAAGWGGRRQLREWLVTKVATGEDSLLQAKPDRGLELAWFKSEVGRWGEIAGLAGESRFLPRLFSEIGLDQMERPEVLVVTSDPERVSDEAQRPILIQVGNDRWWYSPTGRQRAGQLTSLAEHAVIVACRPPKIGDLAARAHRTVLLIQHCGGGSAFSWRALRHGSIAELLSANREVAAMWLNVAGLRQILPLERDLVNRRPALRELRRLSRWREDRWDQALNAFRSSAVLDLVLFHRASRELL